MRLAEPYWLLLILLVPLTWFRGLRRPPLAWPTLGGFAHGPRGWAWWARPVPPLLRGLAIVGMAVAMARPQTVGGMTRVAGKGVAIVAAIDRSSSMNTADFPAERGPIARLEGARRTLAAFVLGRPDDVIGLVGFANEPDLDCAPTLHHARLLEAVRALRPARAGDDGTNIGDAIAWSLRAVLKTVPRRKVLVLLTDGLNSPAVPEPTDPVAAATLARDLGVTLHTIAVGKPPGGKEGGSKGGPDLALLRHLADLGCGRAFVAADAASLGRVFREIDGLEKSPVQGYIRIRYDEAYAPWAAAAVALLVAERLLTSYRLRRLP